MQPLLNKYCGGSIPVETQEEPKMRSKCLVAITILFSCINTSFALNGLGTAASPWLIQSLADFDEFAANSAYWSGHTRLETNIDLSTRTYTQAPIAGGPSFTGTFDGNSHIISNLTINNTGSGSGCLGLFGQIYNGSVTNLGVENAVIIGAGYVSGFCGYNYGSITSCYSTGSVTGSDSVTGPSYIGGLCGYNGDNGNIISCYSTGSVTGSFSDYFYPVGGLCGKNDYGNITNCYSTAAVNSANGYIGGLCGSNFYGNITSCHSTGAVIGSSSDSFNVGGLCGDTYYGIITSCYSTGAVNGYSNIGGLCGWNTGGSIINCYSTDVVDGSYYAGGLCGCNNGSITSGYSTGSVTGDYCVGGLCGYNSTDITGSYSTGIVIGDDCVGGLVGMNDSDSITACFWDMDTSGLTTSAGGEGKTTTQMRTESTFTSAGWDFVSVWNICDGTSYPRFIWQIPLGDFDCPYGVNLVDFAIFSQAWLTSSGQPDYNEDCDLIDDETINIADLAVFAENWLQRI